VACRTQVNALTPSAGTRAVGVAVRKRFRFVAAANARAVDEPDSEVARRGILEVPRTTRRLRREARRPQPRPPEEGGHAFSAVGEDAKVFACDVCLLCKRKPRTYQRAMCPAAVLARMQIHASHRIVAAASLVYCRAMGPLWQPMRSASEGHAEASQLQSEQQAASRA
jgi:hypothetical protein